MLNPRAIIPPLLLALLSCGVVSAELTRPDSADTELPRVDVPLATRGPVQIRFTPPGDRALVTESDTGTLAVVDTAGGKVLRRFPTGGEQPRGVALTADGAALVTNQFSGTVALLDLQTGQPRARLPLCGEPNDVEVARDGRVAYVSLPGRDEVAVLELPSLRVLGRIPVGRRPQAMALTPDGKLLAVANLQSGSVSILETATRKELRRVSLTGVNLRGIAVTPDGTRAYVTGQIPASTRPTADPLDIWTNTLFELDLSPRTSSVADNSRPPAGAEGRIDFPLGASPDPDGIVALGPERVAVALSGSDQALLVRTPGPYLRAYDPVIQKRTTVGAHPRGLALTPDGKQVWVANELGSTLSVLDAQTLAPIRTIELGTPRKPDLRIEGRYLFGNAGLTRGRQFTCNTCHPEGRMDGQNWEFIHVPDGVPRRNTRSLRGGITLTAPFRWSGHNTDIEEFFQEEITGLMHGPKQPHPPLHALWNMLDQFPLPPNPYRAPDGSLTVEAKRGKLLFEGKAKCSGCHGGEMRGGTGVKAWVGTTAAGQSLDVPHLVGAYDSPPYLHDGRAATLEEIFTQNNEKHKHGSAHLLTREELRAVLRYIREL